MYKKIITLILCVTLCSCTLTPQQRQKWQDFNTVVAPIATIASVGAQGLGAYGIYRQGRAISKGKLQPRIQNNYIQARPRTNNIRARRPYIVPVQPIQSMPYQSVAPKYNNSSRQTNCFTSGNSINCSSY